MTKNSEEEQHNQEYEIWKQALVNLYQKNKSWFIRFLLFIWNTNRLNTLINEMQIDDGDV